MQFPWMAVVPVLLLRAADRIYYFWSSKSPKERAHTTSLRQFLTPFWGRNADRYTIPKSSCCRLQTYRCSNVVVVRPLLTDCQSGLGVCAACCWSRTTPIQGLGSIYRLAHVQKQHTVLHCSGAWGPNAPVQRQQQTVCPTLPPHTPNSPDKDIQIRNLPLVWHHLHRRGQHQLTQQNSATTAPSV